MQLTDAASRLFLDPGPPASQPPDAYTTLFGPVPTYPPSAKKRPVAAASRAYRARASELVGLLSTQRHDLEIYRTLLASHLLRPVPTPAHRIQLLVVALFETRASINLLLDAYKALDSMHAAWLWECVTWADHCCDEEAKNWLEKEAKKAESSSVVLSWDSMMSAWDELLEKLKKEVAVWLARY